jgi:hypothetical protein
LRTRLALALGAWVATGWAAPAPNPQPRRHPSSYRIQNSASPRIMATHPAYRLSGGITGWLDAPDGAADRASRSPSSVCAPRIDSANPPAPSRRGRSLCPLRTVGPRQRQADPTTSASHGRVFRDRGGTRGHPDALLDWRLRGLPMVSSTRTRARDFSARPCFTPTQPVMLNGDRAIVARVRSPSRRAITFLCRRRRARPCCPRRKGSGDEGSSLAGPRMGRRACSRPTRLGLGLDRV